MAQIIKPFVSNDLGAIDDDDLGAIDEVADPSINPLEINKRVEEDRKVKATMAQLQLAQKAKHEAANPVNWTLKQTEDHFKANPPKNPQEEVQAKILVDSKKKALKRITDTLTEEPPDPNIRNWTIDQTNKYFKDNPAKNIKEEAMQQRVIDRKLKENKDSHISVLSQAVRAFMRTSNLEQLSSATSELTDIQEFQKNNPPLPNEKWQQYQKRILTEAKKKADEREKEIVKKGTISQLEPAMMAGLTVAGMSAPLHTAKILAKFTAIDTILNKAGVDEAIHKIPNATARDVLDVVKFGAEGVLAGGSARNAIEGFNKFSKEVGQKTNLGLAGETGPKKVSLPEEKKFQATVYSELEKANKGRTLSDHEKAAQEWVIKNPAQARQNYIDRSIEEFKSDNVLSADVGKFAVKDEPAGLKMTASRSADYHEVGSAMTKAREKELLADKSTVDKPTAFTAGGSGSGKSNLLRAKSEKLGSTLKDDYGLVYDSNMNNYESSVSKINKNLKDGRDVQITYVYRDPVTAWDKGVITRVKSQDRIVPIKNHIETHQDSLPTIRKIDKEFKNNPKVDVVAIDNSFAKGEFKELASLDEVPKFDYTNLKEVLYERTKEAYESGKLTKEQFNTALEGSFDLQKRALEEQTVLDQRRESRLRETESSRAPASGLEKPAEPIQPEEPLQQPSDKRRKFIQTVKDSEKTNPDVAEKIESRYNPISNKETLAAAQDAVKNDYNASIEEVMGPGKPTALSNAKAIVLIDKAQAEGRIADAISLVERTAEKQTELGQAIQALSMYNRLTPEGILMYAQRVTKKAAQESFPDRLKNFLKKSEGMKPEERDKLADQLKIPHISELLAKELLAMANKIKDMPEGREKEIETALMLKKIADTLPKTWGKKASLIQTMAQLLNPKTFVRNLLGNIGFQLTEGLADSVAVSLDIATSLRTGKRTVYLPSAKIQGEGLFQGFKEGVQETVAGVNLKEDNSKFTLPKNGVFDKGVMGFLEKTLRISLGATDRAFYQAAFNQSIRDQVLAAKAMGKDIKEPDAEMIERAHLLGLYRTFQDDNVISRQFVNLKKWLNVNKDFGLGDVILKYPKTPANILARGIEYSPFGFINTVYQLSKPLMGQEFNQEAFVRSTSRALTGTVTQVATGAILANLGIISGKRAKDPDVQSTREEVGVREYQVNISALKRFIMSGFDPEASKLREDDTLVSYDWMLPTSIGLALGANMVIDPKTGYVDRAMNMAEQMATASQTLQEQPLVQGVKRFAQTQNVSEAVTNAFQDIPASFVPTFLNQIRQLTDNTARNTKDPNYFKEAYNKAVVRVPGLAGTLEPRVTARGEDKQMYQFGTNNPFNVFLNPAFVTKYKPDAVSKMVLDIWEMTGQTVQFPRVASAKIKLGSNTSEPIELSPEQYTEFQRYIGNKTDTLFTILSENEGFLNQDDDVKAKKLQGYLADINTAAKIEVLGYKPKKVSNDVISIIQDIATDKKEIDAIDDDELGAIDEEK